MTSSAGTAYAYDASGAVTTVDSMTYVYDGFGRMTQVTDGYVNKDVNYYYDLRSLRKLE